MSLFLYFSKSAPLKCAASKEALNELKAIEGVSRVRVVK